MLATVVDYSKYQGTVSRASHRAMREAGVAGVVVGLWHGLDINPYALSCLANAKAELLRRGGYVVVNNRPGREAVRAGKQAAGGHWPGLFGVAVDVEIKGVTEAIMADAFDEVLRQGQRPFLYTGNWFWNWWALSLGHFPDASAFGAWPAVYNGIKTLESAGTRPGYGPVIGHQYAGSTAAFGTTVDFSVFDAAWLAGPQEEDDMDEPTVRNIVRDEMSKALVPAPGSAQYLPFADKLPSEFGGTWPKWNLFAFVQYLTMLLRRRDNAIAAAGGGVSLDDVRAEIEGASLKAQQ